MRAVRQMSGDGHGASLSRETARKSRQILLSSVRPIFPAARAGAALCQESRSREKLGVQPVWQMPELKEQP